MFYQTPKVHFKQTKVRIQYFCEMLRGSSTTTGNDRDIDGISDSRNELQIKSLKTVYKCRSTGMRCTFPCPSLSMQLSRISPAPSSSTAAASSVALTSRVSRPPLTVHCHQQYCSPFGPNLKSKNSKQRHFD